MCSYAHAERGDEHALMSSYEQVLAHTLMHDEPMSGCSEPS
jgi:hypothetical protein